MAESITRIVLTGGPCAGKTTALVRIVEHFSNLGYKVFTIPEVPTMVTAAGWNYMTDNHDFYYEGEKVILEMQLALEEKITRLASTCKEKCLIVCDRGALDISAYISPEMWQEITSACGTSTEELKSAAHYDAVLHLVTAANGAEQFYTTATNAQRYEPEDEEGLKLARLLDQKTVKAWTGHPHLCVINNQVEFETKINRVLKEISHVLQIPQNIAVERKYIVEVTDTIPDALETEIVQTYLLSEPDTEQRLRRKKWDGKYVNVLTTKKQVSNEKEVVTETQVSNNLYESLLQQADPYRQTIFKKRKSFIWNGQYFELDTYTKPKPGLMILETNGVEKHEDIKFPPFLKVIEDITGKKAYYNNQIALSKN